MHPPTTRSNTARTAVERRAWTSLSVLLTGTLLANLDVFIVVVTLPQMTADLGASEGQQQLVLAGYQLVYAVGLISGGRLGDRYGPIRMFGTGLAVFTAASALCGLAPTANALIAARLVQAGGTALLVPQVYSAIQLLFRPARRHRAFALTGAVMAGGAVSGQLLGGWLAGANLFGWGWRTVFLINLPIAIVALLLLPLCLRLDPPRRDTRLDRPGLALSAAALVAFTTPITLGRDLGWPAWVFACLAGSVPLTALFLRHERHLAARGGPALLPRTLLHREFGFGIGLVALFNSGLNALFLLLSLHLQRGAGFTEWQTGTALLPLAAAFAAASLLAPRLHHRDGAVLRCGTLLTALAYPAAGACALTGEMTPFLLSLAAIGAGQGLVITPMLGVVLRSVPEPAIGAASGLVTTAQQLGAALGVCLFGLLFHTAEHAWHTTASAFALTSVALTATAAGSAILSRRLRPSTP